MIVVKAPVELPVLRAIGLVHFVALEPSARLHMPSVRLRAGVRSKNRCGKARAEQRDEV